MEKNIQTTKFYLSYLVFKNNVTDLYCLNSVLNSAFM